MVKGAYLLMLLAAVVLSASVAYGARTSRTTTRRTTKTTTKATTTTTKATTTTTTTQGPAAKIYTTCVKPGQFALTFDDGPSQYTSKYLLPVLAAAGVKATFFVVGVHAESSLFPAKPGCLGVGCADTTKVSYSQTLKDAYNAGHQIASHTWSHASMNEVTAAALGQQCTQLNDRIFSLIGKRPRVFRPPYGDTNTAGLSVLQQMGFTVVTWNGDSADYYWEDYSSGAAMMDRINYEVKETLDNPAFPPTNKDSIVFLQHDRIPESVNNTANIINMIKAKNKYSFVTIAECLGV